MAEKRNNPDPKPRNEIRANFLLALAVFLISLVLNHTLYRIFIVDIDETHMIKRAVAIFCGELPWVDFKLFTYSPGNYYLLAFVLWLFSPSLTVLRHLWVVLRSISNSLAFLASKHIMPLPFAFIPVCLLILLPFLYYKSLYVLFLLLNLLCLYKFVSEFATKWLLLCGLMAGITLGFRENLAAFAIFTCGTCLILKYASFFKTKSTPFRLRVKSFLTELTKRVGLYTSMVALGVSPLFIYYALRESVSDLGYQLVFGHASRWMEQHVGRSAAFPALDQLLPLPESWDVVFFWIPPLLFFGVAVLLITRFARNKFLSRTDWCILVTLLMSMLTFIQVIITPVFARLLEVGVTIYILGAYLIFLAFKHGAHKLDEAIKSSMIGRALKLSLLSLLLACPAWFTIYGLTQKYVNDRIVAARNPDLLIQSDSDIWLSRKRMQRRLKEIRLFVEKGKKTNARILVVENGLYYFHADLDALREMTLSIKHLSEKSLVSDLEDLQPEYFAIEKWANCSFRMLSKSFQDRFQEKYALVVKKAHFDFYTRKQ
jgi:hypothetical protein